MINVSEISFIQITIRAVSAREFSRDMSTINAAEGERNGLAS